MNDRDRRALVLLRCLSGTPVTMRDLSWTLGHDGRTISTAHRSLYISVVVPDDIQAKPAYRITPAGRARLAELEAMT